MISKGDIAAIGDVVDQLTAEINDMDAAAAIGMSSALAEVKAKIELAVSLMKTRTLNVMDGQPIQIGSTLYAPKPTGKWRPEWRMVRSAVLKAALGDELPTATEAAARAVDIMRDLYVSPSQVPKKGGLDHLGIDLPDIATWEKGVSDIRKIEMDEDPE